ncbi:sulfiredoxin, chloroplastic/mitochondrial-like [Ananas comosus]|uniref:sulfiredoxin n=1 Tax=Ananas comosus TaxID=4615 RepID=A0A6P5FGN9_ANACO|nr:sulfiredoxin, chloroplastic/mitochondrial-like [Ananas comosus]
MSTELLLKIFTLKKVLFGGGIILYANKKTIIVKLRLNVEKEKLTAVGAVLEGTSPARLGGFRCRGARDPGLGLVVPLEQIRRPLMRTRANDPAKVCQLMDSIRQIGLQEPIDVLEVDGVYYGFSGCHRFEAHQRLGLPTIRCKVRRGTKETLRHHMR